MIHDPLPAPAGRSEPDGRLTAAVISLAVHAGLALWMLPGDLDRPRPSPPRSPLPVIDVRLWSMPPSPPSVTAVVEVAPFRTSGHDPPARGPLRRASASIGQLPVPAPAPDSGLPSNARDDPSVGPAPSPSPAGVEPFAPAGSTLSPSPALGASSPSATDTGGLAAAATPGPGGGPGVPSEDMQRRDPGGAGYARAVSHRLAIERQYPRAARLQRRQGTALLRLVIDPAGGLSAPPEVVRSAGHRALDHEAVRMALAAAPFPPPPRNMQALAIDVPVEFTLEAPSAVSLP